MLSPNDLGSPSDEWTTRGCPQEIINFGHILNFKKLLPGDLLLFEPLPSKIEDISREIQREQADLKFPPESSSWTHAAVYIHNVYIVEADFESFISNGVRYVPFWEYVGHHNIRVRRPILKDGLTHDEEMHLRWQIAIEAMAQLPNRYSLRNALWLKTKRTWLKWCLTPSKRGRICTQVYAQAYTRALGEKVVDFFHIRDKDQYGNDLFLPAQLDRSEKLADVAIDWLKVVKPRDRFHA